MRLSNAATAADASAEFELETYAPKRIAASKVLALAGNARGCAGDEGGIDVAEHAANTAHARSVVRTRNAVTVFLGSWGTSSSSRLAALPSADPV
jgi:hypothetical protein